MSESRKNNENNESKQAQPAEGQPAQAEQSQPAQAPAQADIDYDQEAADIAKTLMVPVAQWETDDEKEDDDAEEPITPRARGLSKAAEDEQQTPGAPIPPAPRFFTLSSSNKGVVDRIENKAPNAGKLNLSFSFGTPRNVVYPEPETRPRGLTVVSEDEANTPTTPPSPSANSGTEVKGPVQNQAPAAPASGNQRKEEDEPKPPYQFNK